jgi:hypothetical protein
MSGGKASGGRLMICYVNKYNEPGIGIAEGGKGSVIFVMETGR